MMWETFEPCLTPWADSYCCAVRPDQIIRHPMTAPGTTCPIWIHRLRSARPTLKFEVDVSTLFYIHACIQEPVRSSLTISNSTRQMITTHQQPSLSFRSDPSHPFPFPTM